MRIVIAEFMDAPAVAQLARSFDVLYDPSLVDDAQRLVQEASKADALIVRNRTQVRGELLAALRQCKVLGRLGVGLDNIDVPGCEAAGIQVIPATGANALSVAEYVICTSMLLLRSAYWSTAQVAAGAWPRARLGEGLESAGKTMGIVGFGSIGQMVARMAQGLGMKVQAFDALLGVDAPIYATQQVKPVALEALITESDVVSLHVPLTESTRDLFNARRIASMKAGSVLINTSRGHIVDLMALAAALRSGHLRGAAIDVFDAEPLPANEALSNCPGLLLTPHISGVTTESNERVSGLIAERVAAALHS